MRLRGVNINCELMREAQLYSQLHGELQRELSEPGHPLCKTRPDKIVESQWDEEDATKTKMTNVKLLRNTISYGTPYLIVFHNPMHCNKRLGYGQEKKKIIHKSYNPAENIRKQLRTSENIQRSSDIILRTTEDPS